MPPAPSSIESREVINTRRRVPGVDASDDSQTGARDRCRREEHRVRPGARDKLRLGATSGAPATRQDPDSWGDHRSEKCNASKAASVWLGWKAATR